MKSARKLLAAFLALAMVLCMIPATAGAISAQSHRDLARETAGEGMVLLKNRNDILPLDSSDTVALFGSGSVNYGYGGGGSGDVQINYTPDSATKL